MIATYAPMFLMLLVAAGIAVPVLRGGDVPRPPQEPQPRQEGAVRVRQREHGRPHLKLSVKFYLTAILFVVFDIEAVFVYPWAIHFRDLGWAGWPRWWASSPSRRRARLRVEEGSPRMGDVSGDSIDRPRGQRARLRDDAGRRAARLGAQVLALRVPVRHGVLRHGVHGAGRARASTSRASAPRRRASRRARATCSGSSAPSASARRPVLKRIYEQMMEPKWVLAFGTCASSRRLLRQLHDRAGHRQNHPVRRLRPRAARRGPRRCSTA